jgi:hypothetical protein
MKPEAVFIANVVAALIALTLVGLAVRRRLAEAPIFTLYLLTALTTNRLVTAWPDQFFVWKVWVAKEVVLQVLVLGVALEVAGVALRPFPAARRVALVAVSSITLVTAAGALIAEPGDYYRAMAVLIPWLSGGAAVAFGALALVTLWSVLPVNRFHRLVIGGFFLHLTAYVALLSLVKHFGWSAYPLVAALDPAAFAASVGLWALGAWRGRTASEELAERLWWEVVSPDHAAYYANLAKQLEDQAQALRFTRVEAEAAERSGDPELAARLRAAGRAYADATAMLDLRARSGLAIRKRMLAALRSTADRIRGPDRSAVAAKPREAARVPAWRRRQP